MTDAHGMTDEAVAAASDLDARVEDGDADDEHQPKRRRNDNGKQLDADALGGVGPGGGADDEAVDFGDGQDEEEVPAKSPAKRRGADKENGEPNSQGADEAGDEAGGAGAGEEDEDEDLTDENVHEQVDEILGKVPTYKDGSVNFTKPTTCVYMAKVVDLLLPGRFKRDSAGCFWSCKLDTNTWSTCGSIFTELVSKLESHQSELDKQDVFLELVLAYSNKRASELKTRLANIHGDRTFHEKLDRTLMPGQLAFRNGNLLDCSSSVPSFDSLTPEHYVSVTGTIDRDLPKEDDFWPEWDDDTTLEELERMIRKNFCDEASYQQVCLSQCWPIGGRGEESTRS
jgi:hypothetical protein